MNKTQLAITNEKLDNFVKISLYKTKAKIETMKEEL